MSESCYSSSSCILSLSFFLSDCLPDSFSSVLSSTFSSCFSSCWASWTAYSFFASPTASWCLFKSILSWVRALSFFSSFFLTSRTFKAWFFLSFFDFLAFFNWANLVFLDLRFDFSDEIYSSIVSMLVFTCTRAYFSSFMMVSLSFGLGFSSTSFLTSGLISFYSSLGASSWSNWEAWWIKSLVEVSAVGFSFCSWGSSFWLSIKVVGSSLS